MGGWQRSIDSEVYVFLKKREKKVSLHWINWIVRIYLDTKAAKTVLSGKCLGERNRKFRILQLLEF